MMRSITLLFVFIALAAPGQTIMPAQQKALNNYIQYTNKATEEVDRMVKSIIEYYPSIEYSKRKNAAFRKSYYCQIQLEDFFLKKALQDSKILSSAANLNSKLNALRASSEKIDSQCKALDTYHKLEDFKQDNYAKAEELIGQFPALLQDYRKNQDALMQTLEEVYSKLNKYSDANPYMKADRQMRQQIKNEKVLIDAWTFNLQDDIHTGWPVDQLTQSISETDKQLKSFEAYNPTLKYPASSMWSSYKNSLASILESKRSALDAYNAEAKKSDKHSNNVYMDLINYFNGALVSDYNTFIEFSERDNYAGLKFMTFAPAFEIRKEVKTVNVEVKPFIDIVKSPLAITQQKSAITKNTFTSLNNYIDFINEALRQIDYAQQILRNLNSSAAYYKDVISYKGKGGLHYSYENYQLPLSLFQKTTAESKSISPLFAKTLNDETQVLLNILKEIEQQSAVLEIEANEKRYEQDNLTKLYQIIERTGELFKIFDVKKEQLYDDVRKIYESYPIANPSSSWSVSGKALQQLVDLDHEGLFQAKAFYNGDLNVTVSTGKLGETLRQVISNEYTNMKGIEKFGRYNGLCPYSPYEDLPETSRNLSEEFNKLKPVNQSTGYQHPYHTMVYMYNDIIDDLNKFSELSKDIFLLKCIKQPELFEVKYPGAKPLGKKPPESDVVKTEVPRVPEKNSINSPVQPEIKDKSSILHDTVYIEKRDTIYMADPGENLRSMEGYATNNMILLLDVSGSMNTPEKLPLLKKSVLDLLTMMRQEDKVSIISYSGKAKVLLSPTSFKEEDKIKKVIESLKSSGKTDGNSALKLAYKVADENYIRGGNNRIILATDGEFQISEETLQMITTFAKQDIFISVFNFGKSGNASRNLEKLSTSGNGNYENITKDNIEIKLIREAKAKRKK
jgi:Ca-activated chloride channel family protein